MQWSEAPHKVAAKSSSKGALTHKPFENDNYDSDQESFEIEDLPPLDLTTGSEFETGHDSSNSEENDGPESQSDGNMSVDDEVQQVASRKVKDHLYFPMFMSI